MTNVATLPVERQSLIASMASQYNMDPKAFAATVKATCMPANATNEEFAAFLMVAKDYGLNPITREIYAFPKKGGGVQPIVGVDGWFNLINSHPQCDGIDFKDEFDSKGNLTAVVCSIYRKDRNRPTVVTEYMDECKRPTEPWQKWPKRMLRHKAAIQCARYAFGFAGIIDPDEAERSPEVITSQSVVAPPPPPAVGKTYDFEDAQAVDVTGEQGSEFDFGAYLEELETSIGSAKDAEEVATIWNDYDAPATLETAGHADMIDAAYSIRDRALVKFAEVAGG